MTLRGQSAMAFADEWVGEVPLSFVNAVLATDHYLGPSWRGVAWRDEFGVMVFQSPPTSRNLPQSWVELVRWCLRGVKNGGSRQWSACRGWLLDRFPSASTVVSYSDPGAGHSGALYRACGWLWAPTWHRLVEPPTGNGSWRPGVREGAKDRWVFHLRADESRGGALALDESYRRRFPHAVYPDANWKAHRAAEASP